jgi:hypothetical protein
MISDYMHNTAKDLGIHPEEARDLLLQGRIGGSGSWAPPFARGGRVNGDDLYQSFMFNDGKDFREGGEVYNDMLRYKTMYADARGGEVGSGHFGSLV